jgi:hypothetical protein
MRAITLSVIAGLTTAVALTAAGLVSDPARLRDLGIGPSSAAALPDPADEDVPGPLRPTGTVPGPAQATPGRRTPAPTPPPRPADIKTQSRERAIVGWEGRFRAGRSGETESAEARALVRLPGRELVFENFAVADRPDLEVWLVAADRVTTADDALSAKRVSLGRLKKPAGNQTYRLPQELDVAVYRHVVVWSRRDRSPRLAALLQPRRGP